MITALRVISPSQCAQLAVDEICAPCKSCTRKAELKALDLPAPCSVCIAERSEAIKNRLRAIVRETLEACAQLAEDYATDCGLYGQDAQGIEPDAICDGIAEEIRKLADERVTKY